ncbi:hypothetical protein, partial [Clostridium sp.]|uniref:hypothetical protein n=1 Tax=Clostridium sp. TaxID=1506 RepID=UPI0028440760
MKIVEEKYNIIQSVQDSLIISKTELDSIIMKMYNAIADDPEGYENYITKRNIEHQDKVKSKLMNSTHPNFSVTLGFIERKIEEEYSRTFLRLIEIPYYLKVNIISRSMIKHKSPLDGRTRDVVTITGKIEEIIKGNKKFKIGDIISFKYFNHLADMRHGGFEKGHSYFVPLDKTNSDYTDLKGNYVLKFLDDNASYLIENNIINTEENYFMIADKTDWDNF